MIVITLREMGRPDVISPDVISPDLWELIEEEFGDRTAGVIFSHRDSAIFLMDAQTMGDVRDFVRAHMTNLGLPPEALSGDPWKQ